MKEFKFPEFQIHRDEHLSFASKTVSYYHGLMSDNCQVANKILGYLKWWLVNHIQVSDKKYIDCFKKNGLK